MAFVDFLFFLRIDYCLAQDLDTIKVLVLMYNILCLTWVNVSFCDIFSLLPLDDKSNENKYPR